MAVVGHWNNLAEAEKLTQSMLQSGVIQTVIDEGHLLPRLAIKQITGIDYVYNREDSFNAEDGAAFYDIREEIPWTSDVTYTKVTVPLKRIIRQDPIDNFIKMTYNDPNDYQALMIAQLVKRMTRFIEHNLIYGDVDFGPVSNKEFDGLHALGAANTGNLDIDANGAFSIRELRLALNAMKISDAQLGKGGVIILAGDVVATRLDAAYEEQGLASNNSITRLAATRDAVGQRQLTFDAIPIIRSDFLQSEQAATGEGSDAKALFTSGTAEYSLFVIRIGQTEDSGLSWLFGGDTGPAEFMRHVHFEVLEGYDSGGERMVTYGAPALGASHSLARIHGITDAAIIL